MIERKDLFHIPFYKKSPAYYGSFKGMRYALSKKERETSDPDKKENVLEAVVFPGPFGFDATPDSLKTSADFPFSEDGIQAACDWMNRMYEEKPDEWAKGMHILPPESSI